MNSRTICQMEVHPELIRLRRERTELFRKWRVIYGGDFFQGLRQNDFGAAQSLLGLLGIGGIGASK